MSGGVFSPKDFVGCDYVLYYGFKFNRLGDSIYGSSVCSFSLNKDGVCFAVGSFSESSEVEGVSHIKALIRGLSFLPKGSSLGILAHDSETMMTLTKWLPMWDKRGYKNMDGDVVPNADLWKEVWSYLRGVDLRVLTLRDYDSSSSGAFCTSVIGNRLKDK